MTVRITLIEARNSGKERVGSLFMQPLMTKEWI